MKNILAALFATCCLSTTALLAESPEKGQSFKKDIEYLFNLIENTALTVDMRHQIYGLDFRKIKRELLPLADSVKNSAECAVLSHQILSRDKSGIYSATHIESRGEMLKMLKCLVDRN